MIRALIVVLITAIVGVWLFDWLQANPGIASITLGMQRFEMTTATLVLGMVLICILAYVAIRMLLTLLNLDNVLAQNYHARMSVKASRNLSLGLMQLAEGHWEKAEQLLTEHVEHSDTPLLNYLIAARAAHMQHKPELRDELLRRAIQTDSTAQVAVGVSQAEMQLNDRQLEQAHATLLELRNIAPKNVYVLKLYAKTLYQQENWDALFDLLPDLLKHKLLNRKSQSMQQLQIAALQGAFDKYAKKQQVDKLQALWKRLPTAIRQQPDTAIRYANALHQAQADALCAQFIVKANQAEWNPQLTHLYGKIQHTQLKSAIQSGEQWLRERPDNPDILLLLARLNAKQGAPEQARNYYQRSLDQSPHQEGYLELAELLEQAGEQDSAARCYRMGLRYANNRSIERLALPAARPEQTLS